MGVIILAPVLIATAVLATIGAIAAERASEDSNREDIPFELPNRRVSRSNSRSRRTSNRTRRQRSDRHDDDSSSKIDEKASHDIARHIFARLNRWFRFGGLLQRIEYDTDILRPHIVGVGPSVYQDRNSGRGRYIHAAHIIRAGHINCRLREMHNLHYNGLRDFIGHTQNVVMEANVGGIGRAIDEFQVNMINLYMLYEIDFTYRCAHVSLNDENLMSLVVDAYVDMLSECANRTTDKTLRDAIESAIRLIHNTPICHFYKAGKKGYDAHYQCWRRNDYED